MSSRHPYIFSLNDKENIDFITARANFKIIDIVRLGIKEALKSCPKPSKEAIKKAKDIVN